MREHMDAGGGCGMQRLAGIFLLLLLCLAPAHAHFGSCEDHTPLCPRYAEAGDCETRKNYMLQNCPFSCDSCVDPDCYDRSNRCSGSAQQGLCETQKAFMHAQCPHSCHACKIGTRRGVADRNTKTIINPDFECGRPITGGSRKKRQIIFPDELEEILRQAGTRALRPQTSPVQSIPESVSLLNKEAGSIGGLTINDTFCGATPITDRFLLTAAHCINHNNVANTVRLGELDFNLANEPNSMPRDYEIERIFIHSDYDSSTRERYNDIAIIRTKEKMLFSHLVYPFCISENSPTPGAIVTAAGFGSASATHRPSHVQEVQLEVLENWRCENQYRESGLMVELRKRYPDLLQEKGLLCAYYPQRGTCEGDSGGPLFEDRNGRRYLVGIVSTGLSCRSGTSSSFPGVYIDVAHQIDFINSVVYSPVWQ